MVESEKRRTTLSAHTTYISSMATHTATDALKVFTALFGFWYTVNYWIGSSHAPPSEHLYSWTAFWTSCSFVCAHYAHPWPFTGGVIAWTGLMKNSGMLWSSYPIQETQSIGAWLSWIAALVVTILAAGGAFYRVFSVPWHVNAAARSVRLDEESA